jgi:dTDP-4-amino-4,6-dideoxygalactose transaminase
VRTLEESGIEPRRFWKPVHAHGVHASSGEFPNAYWVAAHGLWLPSALSLEREDVAAVGRAVRTFVNAPSPTSA